MIIPSTFTVGLALALLTTLVATEILRRLAPRFGLLDRPGGRKQHCSPTPVVGGLAMAAGLAVCWALLPETRPHTAWLLGFAAFVLLGAVDDSLHLRAGSKFLIQAFIATCVVIASELGLPSLGEVLPGWVVGLGVFSIPFAVFAIVSVMNAVNMSDGVDGLAGSLGVVALLSLALMSQLAGHTVTALQVLLPAAALFGFLAFNLRGPMGLPARVFMGDAGSLSLGFLIAVFALVIASPDRVGVPPAVVIWCCFMPLADGLSVILRRLSRRSGAMKPGRDHLHHLLLARGLRPGGVVAVESGLGMGAALLATIGWRLGLADWVLIAAFCGSFVAFHLLVSRAWAAAAPTPVLLVEPASVDTRAAVDQRAA